MYQNSPDTLFHEAIFVTSRQRDGEGGEEGGREQKSCSINKKGNIVTTFVDLLRLCMMYDSAEAAACSTHGHFELMFSQNAARRLPDVSFAAYKSLSASVQNMVLPTPGEAAYKQQYSTVLFVPAVVPWTILTTKHACQHCVVRMPVGLVMVVFAGCGAGAVHPSAVHPLCSRLAHR